MYEYETEKKAIFTEEGQVMFLRIRDHVQRCIKLSGAVSMGNAMSATGVGGDTWTRMACVDRLVELGEIREVAQQECAGQNRVFVKTGE